MVDLHFLIAIFFIFYVDNISLFSTQKLCRFFTDNYAIIRQMILLFGLTVTEMYIILCIFVRTYDTFISIPLFLSVCQCNFLHICIYISVQIFVIFQILLQIFPIPFSQILLQVYASIIHLYLRILKIRNLIYGITQTKSNQHQCHTSTDTKYRHKKSFFVAYKIPNRRLPRKIQMSPYHLYPL